MKKRWTLFPLALGLSLCLLAGCQTQTDADKADDTAAISDSQLYATVRSTFLQEQSQQLQELDALLQELEQLVSKDADAYDLGHLTGRAIADRNEGDAYQSLCRNTPEQIVQQLIPAEQGKANEAYAAARLDFLETLAAQTDLTALAGANTEFAAALPALREAFQKIDLTQQQLENLENAKDDAATDYVQNMQDFAAQLSQATALLH